LTGGDGEGGQIHEGTGPLGCGRATLENQYPEYR
jgi:hypothetical protein